MVPDIFMVPPPVAEAIGDDGIFMVISTLADLTSDVFSYAAVRARVICEWDCASDSVPLSEPPPQATAPVQSSAVAAAVPSARRTTTVISIPPLRTCVLSAPYRTPRTAVRGSAGLGHVVEVDGVVGGRPLGAGLRAVVAVADRAGEIARALGAPHQEVAGVEPDVDALLARGPPVVGGRTPCTVSRPTLRTSSAFASALRESAGVRSLCASYGWRIQCRPPWKAANASVMRV